MLPYLAPVKSPMQIHCEMLKQQYPDALTVFIGPCYAKKGEAKNSDSVMSNAKAMRVTFDNSTSFAAHLIMLVKVVYGIAVFLQKAYLVIPLSLSSCCVLLAMA